MSENPGIRRNLGYRLVLEFSAKFAGLGLNIWLARQLGTGGWGLMQWALASAGIAGAFADLGMGGVIAREVTLAPEGERWAWFKAGYVLRTLFWGVALAGCAAAALLAGPGRGGLLLAALVLVATQSFGDLNTATFIALERLDLDLSLGLMSRLGQVAAAAAVLAWGGGPGAVLVAMACAASAAQLWGFWRAQGRLRPQALARDWRPMVRPLLSALWPFGLVPFLVLAYSKIDTLIVERLMGMDAVGRYQAAYRWMEASGVLASAFVMAASPHLNRAGREGLRGWEPQRKALMLLGGGGLITLAALAGLAQWLPWIYGDAYLPSAQVLRILAWSGPVYFMNVGLVTVQMAHRRQGMMAYGAALCLALNVAGNYWAVPRWGLAGAAALTVATELCMTAFHFWILRRVLPLGRLRAPGLALAASAGLVWALAVACGRWGLVVGPLAALGLAVAFGWIPREELGRLARGRGGAA